MSENEFRSGLSCFLKCFQCGGGSDNLTEGESAFRIDHDFFLSFRFPYKEESEKKGNPPNGGAAYLGAKFSTGVGRKVEIEPGLVLELQTPDDSIAFAFHDDKWSHES